MEIYQGDAFDIPITLSMDGITITPDILSELEITFDTITKRLSKRSILFDNEFIFPLTQQETLRLSPGKYYMHARIKILESNEVFGLRLDPEIIVLPSASKEVI